MVKTLLVIKRTMSKHFLVLQHIAIEHPGFIRDLMKQANITWDTIHLDKGQSLPTNVSNYSAVLSMGGPMDVWEKEHHSWIHDEECLYGMGIGL